MVVHIGFVVLSSLKGLEYISALVLWCDWIARRPTFNSNIWETIVTYWHQGRDILKPF